MEKVINFGSQPSRVYISLKTDTIYWIYSSIIICNLYGKGGLSCKIDRRAIVLVISSFIFKTDELALSFLTYWSMTLDKNILLH